MADDMVVLQCEKCGTRLKVRAVAIKVLKEVKCAKCGHKVPTKGAVPAPEPASVQPAAPPPEPAAPESPVVPAVAAAPEPPRPAVPDLAPELAAARARAAELEQVVAARDAAIEELKRRVAELESRPAPVAPPQADSSAELAETRRTIAEQEARISELQTLWYEKERESRTALSSVSQARQERDAVLGGIRSLLKSYHEAEIQAATDRINQLDERIRKFLGG